MLVSVLLISGLLAAGSCKPKPEENEIASIVLGMHSAIGVDFGDEQVKAARLAVEEINAAGGVSVGGVKRPFKFVVIDTRDFDPTIPIHDTFLAYEKIILEQKADVLVTGPGRSEALLAVMEKIAQYKIVHIFSGGMTPTFNKQVKENYDRYKYFSELLLLR